MITPGLKTKYLNTDPYKGGGQKKSKGNSGGVGRAIRREKRSLLGPSPAKKEARPASPPEQPVARWVRRRANGLFKAARA